MLRLTVFDSKYNLERELEDDHHFDVALEISTKMKGGEISLSKDAKEMLYIEDSVFRTTFIKTMLFARANIELIATVMGLTEDMVLLYRELYFNVELIRGELGMTEMYESLMGRYPEGSMQHSFALMLRDAHMGGVDIVLAQFNIRQNHYSVSNYKDRQQALLQWRLDTVEADNGDYEKLLLEIKARDATLAALSKASSKDDKAKMSDLGALVKVLDLMHEKDIGKKEEGVASFDIETGTVIEAEAIAIPEKIEDSK